MSKHPVVIALILDKEGYEHWVERMGYLMAFKPRNGGVMSALDIIFKDCERIAVLGDSGIIWTWSQPVWDTILSEYPQFVLDLKDQLDTIPEKHVSILGEWPYRATVPLIL